jgi:hypothetical protein
MDPLRMADTFERLFGIHLPGWLVVFLVLVALFLLTGAVINQTVQWVKWYREPEVRARLRAIVTSSLFQRVFNFRSLFRVAVVLWVILVSVSLWKLRDDMDRYVVPRRLTEHQIVTIADYLAKHDPQEVRFVVTKNNEEASQYRGDFHRALEKGGWPVASVDYSVDVPEGVRIQIHGPFRQPETPLERLQRKPGQERYSSLHCARPGSISQAQDLVRVGI